MHRINNWSNVTEVKLENLISNFIINYIYVHDGQIDEFINEIKVVDYNSMLFFFHFKFDRTFPIQSIRSKTFYFRFDKNVNVSFSCEIVNIFTSFHGCENNFSLPLRVLPQSSSLLFSSTIFKIKIVSTTERFRRSKKEYIYRLTILPWNKINFTMFVSIQTLTTGFNILKFNPLNPLLWLRYFTRACRLDLWRRKCKTI